MIFGIKPRLQEGYDDDGSGALGKAFEAAFIPEWHAPGIGEIHNRDHSSIIICMKYENDEEVIDNDLAVRVCNTLNRKQNED